MSVLLKKIENWHQKCRGKSPEKPMIIPFAEVNPLMRIVDEEYSELCDAVIDHDLPGIADACGDLIWTVIGVSTAHGIPITPVLEAIADSNYSKFDAEDNPVFNEANKVMKGPNYIPPDIVSVLRNAGM